MFCIIFSLSHSAYYISLCRSTTSLFNRNYFYFIYYITRKVTETPKINKMIIFVIFLFWYVYLFVQWRRMILCDGHTHTQCDVMTPMKRKICSIYRLNVRTHTRQGMINNILCTVLLFYYFYIDIRHTRVYVQICRFVTFFSLYYTYNH